MKKRAQEYWDMFKDATGTANPDEVMGRKSCHANVDAVNEAKKAQ